MPTIEDFPTEILENIFRRISKYDFYGSLLVSKSWYTTAYSIHYESMNLSSRVIDKLYEKLEINSNFQTFHSTKYLKISSDAYNDSPFIDPEVYSFIFSLFPNVKALYLGDSGEHRTYNLNLLLIQCDPEVILRNLEKITIIHDGNLQVGEEDLYFQVQYKFRRTLKYLHVVNDFGYEQSWILKDLSEFKKLEELVFINETTANLTIFPMLDKCNNLTSLTFKSKIDVDRSLLNNYHTGQLKNLKEIIIEVPYFTRPYIDYFIQYCPESLTRLEITFTDEDFYNWIDDISIEVILQLAKRMSKLQTYKIASFQNVRCTKREGIPKNDTKINVFHKVLSALKGDEFKDCIGLYQDSTFPGVSLLCDKTKSYIGYDYYVDHEDYGIEKQDKGEDLVKYNQIPIPDINLSVGPSTTTEIRYSIQVVYFLKLPKVQLEHTKKYFTNILSFKTVYKVPTCKMIATQRDSKIKSRLEDMTNCILKGAQHSQELLNDLTYFFPKLEILKYEIANHYQPFGRKQKDNIYLDLSKFKHLKGLILELYNVTYLQNHYIFFDVSFSDRTESPAFFTINGWRTKDPEHQSENDGQFRQVEMQFINQLWGDPNSSVFIIAMDLPAVKESFKLIYSKSDVEVGRVTLTRQ